MADLKSTPERRDSEGPHVPEPESAPEAAETEEAPAEDTSSEESQIEVPEQQEQQAQNLENALQVVQGNCDVVTVEILYKLYQRVGVMNQNLVALIQLLDKRLAVAKAPEKDTESKE